MFNLITKKKNPVFYEYPLTFVSILHIAPSRGGYLLGRDKPQGDILILNLVSEAFLTRLNLEDSFYHYFKILYHPCLQLY